MKSTKVSIITPCFNEEGNIKLFYNNVKKQLKGFVYEILYINDGSTDNTLEEIKKIKKRDKNVKYISLSRNFGHQSALKAGYDHADGDCIISMDTDLQHPPEIIKKLINKWEEGYDVVITLRKDNKIGFFKRVTASIFYKLINILSDTKINRGAADFRLIDKKVLIALKKFNENFLFIRGIISWMGFKQYEIEYHPNKRKSGKTKYSIKKMVKFAITGITSFSIKPLRFAIYIGIIIAFFSFIYGLYVIYMAIFTNNTITGWASLITSVLFIGGIQIIILGIIGEYLGKLFIENKGRPNYIIEEEG